VLTGLTNETILLQKRSIRKQRLCPFLDRHYHRTLSADAPPPKQSLLIASGNPAGYPSGSGIGSSKRRFQLVAAIR
jgi:hypothetical protein